MRTAASIVLTTSLLVGCSAAQPSITPPSASPAPAPIPAPQATASPPPLSEPTATPTALPDATGATFEWGEATEMVGLGGLDRPRIAYADGTYVLMEGPRVWSSADATTWLESDLSFGDDDFIELNGLVAAGPGFVIVGTETIDADADGDADDSAGLVLTSSDGRSWERLNDWRFAHSGINHLGSSRQGLVAFGNTRNAGSSIWTSVDGTAWLKATNETGLEVAGGVQLVAEHDGRLTAFVRRPGGDPYELGPVDVWQTEGRAEWQKVGALPDPSAIVHRAAFGGGRWLAVGYAPPDDPNNAPDAWTSTDGRTWTRTAAPIEAHAAIAGWADGMIAASHTGSSPGETCGGSEPYVGRSRISLSGGDWIVVPPTEGAAATALLVVGDRILAIGVSTRQNVVSLVRWLAPLPQVVVAPASTPTPAPTQRSEGCGG